MADEKNPEPNVDFATFLLDLSHGEINATLSEKLAEIVTAVQETGKAGALTVKIAIKQEGAMAVAHVDHSSKLPQADLPGTMFFFGKIPGELCREDPRQLSFREIATPNQPMRVVGGNDAEGRDE